MTIQPTLTEARDARFRQFQERTELISLELDLSFAHLSRAETLWGPHGYHRYPAKFIPQLVRYIIETYSVPNDLVADPFLGSGTTGVEALRTRRRFWGADVNPVALLISQAKCTPLDPAGLRAIVAQLDTTLAAMPLIGRRCLTADELKAIQSINIAHMDASERMNYWFPAAHREALAMLLNLLLQLPDNAYRTFFLCAFSNILRRCSIWLSGSTKPQKDLEKHLSDPKEEFRKQIRDMERRNQVYWNDITRLDGGTAQTNYHAQIGLEDARRSSLRDGSIDLLVTSPPYATCYEYIDLHQLTQLWLEQRAILPQVDLQHICIGSKDVSGRQGQATAAITTGSGSADHALACLAEKATGKLTSAVQREARALRHYFQDMCAVFHEFARVVAPNKYLVLVIGDSAKRDVPIPTSAAVVELATAAGFTLQRTILRKVPARVLVSQRDKKSGRFSSTAQSDSQAYPEESVLVFTR